MGGAGGGTNCHPHATPLILQNAHNRAILREGGVAGGIFFSTADPLTI